jgi:hypothetical protein
VKTVLGFDSWTQGSVYFDRLVPELEQRGYRLILIHLGSWGHDPGRPAEERIGQLTLRDIGFYGGKGFRDILELERPAGVIYFSTRSLAHQAFNLYCRFLGIPTVHLYHGLATVQAFQSGGSAFRVNWLNQLTLVSTRLGKNLFKIWPTYLRALVDTRARPSAWLDFLQQLSNKIQGKITPAPLAATTDAGCVYTAADVEHMQRNYHIPDDYISVVGNPDVSGFGLSEGNLAHCLDNEGGTNEVLYIDTAFNESGMVFSDADAFAQHLVQSAEALSRQGLKLVAKLHPAHGRTGVADTLRSQGVAICSGSEFVERLMQAKAALVEPSTAALIPALLGLPLLLAEYGPLTGQAYGEALTGYPRACSLTNIADASRIIDEVRSSDRLDASRVWIDQNSGPLPASRMSERAAEAIIATLNRKALP